MLGIGASKTILSLRAGLKDRIVIVIAIVIVIVIVIVTHVCIYIYIYIYMCIYIYIYIYGRCPIPPLIFDRRTIPPKPKVM